MARFKKTHGEETIFVWGTGDFPVDMLRYDSCVPATSMDAANIAGNWDSRSGAEHWRTVKLRMFKQDATAKATEARWRSFGWHVIPECLAGHSPEVIRAWIGTERGADYFRIPVDGRGLTPEQKQEILDRVNGPDEGEGTT